MSAEPLPYEHLGEALATDYLFVREQFTDEEWEHFLARAVSSTTRSCR